MRHRPPTFPATVLAALAAIVLVASCGTSGRALRDPDRDVPSPTRSVPTTTAPLSLPSLPLGETTFPSLPDGVFGIVSSAFASGGALPTELVCAGPSPALRWQGVPEGTSELALVVTETAEGGQVHWVVTGISPISDGVGQGQVPAGASQLTNSLGQSGWSAPCPPVGSTENITISLLALTQPAVVPEGTPPTDAVGLLTEQAQGNVTMLTATATR